MKWIIKVCESMWVCYNLPTSWQQELVTKYTRVISLLKLYLLNWFLSLLFFYCTGFTVLIPYWTDSILHCFLTELVPFCIGSLLYWFPTKLIPSWVGSFLYWFPTCCIPRYTESLSYRPLLFWLPEFQRLQRLLSLCVCFLIVPLLYNSVKNKKFS